MKNIIIAISLFGLAACQSTGTKQSAGADNSNASDACGAEKLQYLVGGPSSATTKLDIPDDSRHYGSEEGIDSNEIPARLNIVHSGTALEAVANPESKVVRVFCG